MGFIGYIQMFDLSTIVRYEKTTYFDYIQSFHKHVAGLANKFLVNGKAYMFSDSALIHSINLVELLEFYDYLRHVLMVEGIFFSASLTEGELCAEVQFMNERVSSTLFHDENVVKAIALNKQFEGIGINIDEDLIIQDVKNGKNEFDRFKVQSVYWESESFNGLKNFYDIKFSNFSPKTLRFIIHNYLQTQILNEKAARRYISILRTFILGLSIAHIAPDLDEVQRRFNFTEYVNLLIGDDREYSMLKKPEYTVIHLMLINQICSLYFETSEEYDDEAAFSKVSLIMNRIFNKVDFSAFIGKLDNIPEIILSKRNKHIFAKSYLNFVMSS